MLGNARFLAATALVLSFGIGTADADSHAGSNEIQVGEDVTVTPKVQYRIRAEANTGKDFASGNRFGVIAQRARLGLESKLAGKYKIFLQLQDVRTWGEETNTLGDFSADNFDFHQAYAELNEGPITFRLGRQEMIYDGQRLIGAVGWTNQGRSFDAARIMWRGYGAEAHLFYAKLREEDSGTSAPNQDFFGVWANYGQMAAFKPSVLFLVDRNDATDMTRLTTGLYAKGALTGGFKYEGEGYLQFGEVGASDILAFLIAARVGYAIPAPALKPEVWIWGEYLSGDNDTDDKVETFDTLFATNHKFYGFMDFFLGIPANTGGAGLIDLGGRVKVVPFEGVTAMVDYHFFRAAKSLVDSDGNDTKSFGSEIDVTLKGKVNKFATIVAGGGVLIPSEGISCARLGTCNPDPDTELFGYLMVDVKH